MAEMDDALPISGLQHLAFCPRQWALIHLEQAWAENRLTAEGRLLHERVDLPGQSWREALRTVRGMELEHRGLRRSTLPRFRAWSVATGRRLPSAAGLAGRSLDRCNALLSFVYALLRHDIKSALEGVGLDPAVGFLHADRPGGRAWRWT